MLREAHTHTDTLTYTHSHTILYTSVSLKWGWVWVGGEGAYITRILTPPNDKTECVIMRRARM